MTTKEVWHSTAPVSGIDKRVRLTRDRGLVTQRVRVWRGRVVRKGGDDVRHPVYDTCFHGHNKQAAAKKCADAAAKRLNRAIAKGETWPWEVGVGG